MSRYVFLIATERSGSNFFTSLLGSHSQISGPPPSHLFRLFVSNIENYGDLFIDSNWDRLVQDFALNFQAKLGVWQVSITEEELKQKAEARSLAALLRVTYEKQAAQERATTILVKENHTYRFVDFLFAEIPECKLVYLVRDPRDVAASWIETRGIPGGVEKACTTWLADQEASLALCGDSRCTGRLYRLRYEELIGDTAHELRRLMAFMDLPEEPVWESFYREARVEVNAERIFAWRNLAKPVMSGNSGKYNSLLTKVDHLYVELRCYDAMLALGYEPDLVTRRPSAAEVEDKVAELETGLSPGGYEIDPKETLIRRRRLDAIERVLSRRPQR